MREGRGSEGIRKGGNQIVGMGKQWGEEVEEIGEEGKMDRRKGMKRGVKESKAKRRKGTERKRCKIGGEERTKKGE